MRCIVRGWVLILLLSGLGQSTTVPMFCSAPVNSVHGLFFWNKEGEDIVSITNYLEGLLTKPFIRNNQLLPPNSYCAVLELFSSYKWFGREARCFIFGTWFKNTVHLLLNAPFLHHHMIFWDENALSLSLLHSLLFPVRFLFTLCLLTGSLISQQLSG